MTLSPPSSPPPPWTLLPRLDSKPAADAAPSPEIEALQRAFDEDFYRAQNPDVDFARIDPLVHFALMGWREGRDPAPWFSVETYLDRHDDIRASGINPFLHYLSYGRQEGREIATSRYAVVQVEPVLVEPAVAAPEPALDPAERAGLELMRPEFDEDFYRAKNRDVDFDETDPLVHFLRTGWREGRDPTPWFSLETYLDRHDDIQRSQINPFLHYLSYGRHEGREIVASRHAVVQAEPVPPEPVVAAPAPAFDQAERADLELMRREFDEDFYRAQNRDVDFSGVAPLAHFARRGWREGRDPNRWFSMRAYAAIHGVNAFLHFLRLGRTEGRAVVDRSLLFVGENTIEISRDDIALLETAVDADFYKEQLPDIDFQGLSAAEHYAIAGWNAGLDPAPDFSTRGYLTLNEDIRRANINPFVHFLRTGHAENRDWRFPGQGEPAPDGTVEWADYAHVRQRSHESLEGAEPDPEAVRFAVSLLGADLAEAVADLRFSRPGQKREPPLVSIVIPCLNEELVTAECLLAIAQALPSDFGVEVIVADNGSTDPLYAAIAAHPELRHVRFETNIGFGPVCNAAAEKANGEFLFLLNNDAQIAPGCLERLVATARDPSEAARIGAVGPKLLFFDGHLQEAGCLLNRDATGALIGCGRDPRTPRYNYRRDVEHISGAAVLISRALFAALGGFDPVYAPAYCEDADLSLKIRRRGLRLVYEPEAVVAHHLSKTTNGMAETDAEISKRKRIAANRQTLLTRWAGVLGRHDLRTIAFYLPQYHPIKENDLWWGKGFTEWSNVGRAKPNYVGHNQPRTPADLGYYDLRIPDVMEAQAALARRYGVTGFCYYYYNFDGARLLEQPLERMLETGKPDLPFCLCWANENWTRRWDGRDNEILMGQSYSDAAMVRLADDVARYFRSPNYIRIDGKPLFLVYRVKEMPNPKRVTGAWRHRCRAIGIGEICIAMVESFDLSPQPEPPQPYGCDITIEFPAHGMMQDQPKSVERLNGDWKGSVHDYRELVRAFTRRVEPGFPRIRSVLAGWDSTPRHQDRSLVLEHATPGAFQAWLEWAYRRTMEQNLGDSRLVFINAWNEWGEGSYLEPDRRFGHGYLQAVHNALDAIETGGHAFDV
jgi:GT2 family glycosyltransferase